MSTKKAGQQRHGFKTGEFIIYPAHGLGKITAIEEQEIAGFKLELFVVSFVKEKMTLRVPTAKIAQVGMRKLSDAATITNALEILTGRARIKRTMWSRRAQEYEAKINSGDIIAVAEVVRDLYRSEAQPEQSYSERQLYEAALDRLLSEIGAVENITDTEAQRKIEANLAKNPRRSKAAADAAAGEEDDEAEAA
jgi:CarD family transcriptional regulator